MNEKGLVYYYQDKMDKALEIFEEAKKLPNSYPEPYFWAACIYHDKQDFTKALAGYYDAVRLLPSDNSCYITALASIGKLEYTVTKNYLKSAKAYSEAIELNNDDYEIYYKLMKSYNAAKEYEKADNVFKKVKIDYEDKKLPKDDMDIGTVPYAEFSWNEQIAVVNRSLVDPKETLEISYKVFLLNKDGDKIERRFMVEKTLQVGKDGAKHLLCEFDKNTGTHYTYLYGWNTDKIPLDDLIKSIKLVLDGKMKPGASSSYGGK